MIPAALYLLGWLSLAALLLSTLLLAAFLACVLVVTVFTGVAFVGLCLEAAALGIRDWIRDLRRRR